MHSEDDLRRPPPQRPYRPEKRAAPHIGASALCHVEDLKCADGARVGCFGTDLAIEQEMERLRLSLRRASAWRQEIISSLQKLWPRLFMACLKTTDLWLRSIAIQVSELNTQTMMTV